MNNVSRSYIPFMVKVTKTYSKQEREFYTEFEHV